MAFEESHSLDFVCCTLMEWKSLFPHPLCFLQDGGWMPMPAQPQLNPSGKVQVVMSSLFSKYT